MNFDTVVHDHFRELSPLDLDIIRIARADRSRTGDEPIVDFARRCNVSPATIVRLAKKLGLRGYSEMKYLLKATDDSSDTRPGDVTATSRDIDKTFRAFRENPAVNEVITRMSSATSIYAFGAGHGQRLMLEDFGRSLSRYGISVSVFSGFAEARQIAARLSSGHLMFLASQDGDATMLRPALQILDLNEVPSVSLTPFGDNDLAASTTYRLHYFNSHFSPATELNSSTFLLLHLVLHLLQEEYARQVDSPGHTRDGR